ncbi:MAG: Hsp20/alpha crystallin family protein [Nitrososphaerota archaeon]
MIRRRKSLFDIIKDIERDIDQEIEWMLTRIKESEVSSRCLEPLYEIQEFPDEFRITVDLPGVEKESVRLEAHRNELHIYAPCSFEYELRRYCRVSATCYKLELELPIEISIEETRAKFKEGVLEIRIPKKRERSKNKDRLKDY